MAAKQVYLINPSPFWIISVQGLQQPSKAGAVEYDSRISSVDNLSSQVSLLIRDVEFVHNCHNVGTEVFTRRNELFASTKITLIFAVDESIIFTITLTPPYAIIVGQHSGKVGIAR